MTRPLTLRQARRIALAAQGFGRSGAPVTDAALGAMLRRLNQVQIDSVNVCVRAQYVPLFARCGPYDRGLLDRFAGSSPRRLFEYWGHAACLMDVALYPVMRSRMRASASHSWPRLDQARAAHPGIDEAILRDLAARGPLTARQIDHPAAVAAGGGWWNWSAVKCVLEHLLMEGQVSVAGRNSQFERLYALTERVIPRRWRTAPEPADPDLELVRRAAAALGIGTVRCFGDYFRLPLPVARRCVGDLVQAGELAEAPVEGWESPTYLWHRARTPRRIAVDAIVSPFDSLVFERRRLQSLFGVDYTIGLYTPADKRDYGYYVYLYVMDDAIAARVDLKADRAAGVLRVEAAWLEGDGLDAGKNRDAEVACRLAATLQSMADWLGLTDVAVADRGTLSSALSSVVRYKVG